MLQPPEINLLDILKRALSDHSTDSALSCSNWSQIYELAILQGVQALALEGITTLKNESKPDDQLLLNWAVNAKEVERRCYYYKCVATQLIQLFEKNHLRLMLFKGFDLARFYHNPAHREWGDLDIWLFGKQQEGDHIIKEKTQAEIIDKYLHTCFYYKNIPIENHKRIVEGIEDDNYFDRQRFRENDYIESALQTLLQEEAPCYLCLGDACRVEVPSPTFNFIYLACHMTTHLTEEMVLRHLCDWAYFLRSNHGQYDLTKLSQILKGTRLLKMVSIFTYLAVDYLGLSESYIPKSLLLPRNSKQEAKVLLHILRPNLRRKHARGKLMRFVRRLYYFYDEAWVCKLVYGDSAIRQIYRLLYLYCRNGLRFLFSK